MIRLKLINTISLLEKSLALYGQWQPILDKDYHYILTFKSIKSKKDIMAIFNQLNEIYVKANKDFIKLMALPRYKELKLLSYEDMGGLIKEINEGKVDFIKLKKDPDFMKEMKAYGNNKREMEDIEMANLLFPEIAWGSWY